jgi:hypothetical protein
LTITVAARGGLQDSRQHQVVDTPLQLFRFNVSNVKDNQQRMNTRKVLKQYIQRGEAFTEAFSAYLLWKRGIHLEVIEPATHYIQIKSRLEHMCISQT